MKQSLTQIKTGVMQRNHWLLIGGGLVLLAGTLLAWQYYDNRYPSWDEEVRLSDGRVITIHQKHEVYDNYGTNQSWITIDLPELGGKRVWHSYLIPQRIDVVDGKVYVFGMPRGDRQYNHYSDPKNYLVGFTWNGADFLRTPFLGIPESARKEENVYSCVPIQRGSILTATAKESNWCPPKGDDGQFSKQINLPAFQALSIQYARRGGRIPSSN